jgi:hypothetical protein
LPALVDVAAGVAAAAAVPGPDLGNASPPFIDTAMKAV